MIRLTGFISALVFSMPAFSACEFDVEVGDSLQFSTGEIIAGKDCESIKITLSHTGKMASKVMGHNWVLSKNEDFNGIATAGAGAGLENTY
ncbi:MAG: azurin, partial [Pseudomonadota bacterium]